MAVHCAAVDVYVGILLLDTLDSLRSSQQHHELDVGAAVLLHKANGGGGRTAGGQHGIHDQDVPLRHVLGHLAEIFHRLQGLLVTVKADMAHPGRGYHPQHAVHQAKARPENRYHRKFLPLQRGSHGLTDRCLHLFLRQRQVPGGLIGEKHANLGNNLTEIFGRSILIPEDGQLMGQQRMIDDMDFFAVHWCCTPFLMYDGARRIIQPQCLSHPHTLHRDSCWLLYNSRG